MKKIIYFVVLSVLSTTAFAQSAEQILDNVSKHYKDQGSLYVKFNSALDNKAAATSDDFQGEIYIKGDKYNLIINKMNIQQIYDGRKLHTIANDTKEVTITKPEKGSDELFTPTSVLDIYKDGYNVSMDKPKKGLKYVRLTPKDASSEVNYILVGVDTKNNRLKEIVQNNKNKTTTTLTVEKQLDNIIIPKSLLKFDKKFYKGYYISEL